MTKDFLQAETEVGEVMNIPKKIKNYDVVRVLGAGASGVVVLLKDTHRSITLAAKLITRPQANSLNIKALERELRLSVTVKCP